MKTELLRMDQTDSDVKLKKMKKCIQFLQNLVIYVQKCFLESAKVLERRCHHHESNLYYFVYRTFENMNQEGLTQISM